MTVEADIFNALKGLVGNRVFPDVAPIDTARPYIIYQQIGGRSVNYIGSELPDMRHGLFQIACWSNTRMNANELARQVENTLRTSSSFLARPNSDIVAMHEPDIGLYGAIVLYDIWSDA